MTRFNWCLGVLVAAGLANACSSSGSNGVMSVGGTSTVGSAGHAGSATTSGGASSGGTGGASGAAAGGAGGMVCPPEVVGGSGGMAAASGGAAGGGGAPVCTPTCPVELTRAPGCGTMYLAVHKGTLYFTDSAHGLVKSIPVAGGGTAAETTVASDQKKPYAITADDTGVYWSNTGTSPSAAADNTIMMKAPTGTPTKIGDVEQTDAQACKTNIVRGLTLDGKGALYFGAGPNLMKVDAKAGSTPTKIGTFEGLPTAIVLAPPVTPTRIFETLAIDNAVQWRNPDPASSGCMDPVARPMGNSTTGGCAFVESQGALLLDSLTLVGSNVVFANGSNILSADTTVVATSQGKGVGVAATASFEGISGLTTNATTAYFGEATTGIIEKAPLPGAGADPVILVQDLAGEKGPSSFVLDDTNVYWRTEDTCAIMKLPL